MSTQNILLPYKIRDLEISQGYLNRVSKKQKKTKKKKNGPFLKMLYLLHL